MTVETEELPAECHSDLNARDLETSRDPIRSLVNLCPFEVNIIYQYKLFLCKHNQLC